jgi:PilZ domain
MTHVTPEKRKALRQRTLKTATLVSNKRQSVITCTLRSLSSTGALLELPTIVGTPSDFEVCIDGSYRSARVVWRSDMKLGVAWTDLKRG